jgi:GxxExxY protein
MTQQTRFTEKQLNHFSGKIIEAAIKVHRKLGPGLLESAYEKGLTFELSKTGIFIQSQTTLPVHYDDQVIDFGYRADLIVENSILVELKSVEKLSPLHEAQILTYLRLSKFQLGLLINFNVVRLVHGIKRYIK